MKFRSILLLAAVTTVSAPTFSDDGLCQSMHYMAEVTMAARQKGVPMPELMGAVMQTVEQNPDTPENMEMARGLMREIVTRAYEEPRFSTRENQVEAIQDFANEVAAGCYRGSK